MTPWFYIKTKFCKFVANAVSALVTDRQKRHALRERLDPLNPQRCITYLKRHYTNVDAISFSDAEDKGVSIWVCWLQGLDHAPGIVKNCIHSIRHHKSDHMQVVLLTADNLSQYAQLPSYIVEKWEKGKICHAHFTDILRVYLMVRYGGFWIDATCMLTSPIPQEIVGQPVFLYRSHGDFSFTLIQNCFLHSTPNHYIMSKWYAAMLAYWKDENKPIHYFIHHLLFQALLQTDTKFKEEFDKMAILSDEPMHFILNHLLADAKYTESLMNEAQRYSFIHKLSYKFPETFLEDKQSIASRLSEPVI